MGSQYVTIATSAEGPVLRLTLDRPDKRNPIGPETCGELVHALAGAAADPSVRVVVLTGAGAVFSAGGDLSRMSGASADRPPQGSGDPPGSPASAPAPARSASLVELLTAMHELGKPIIAMVNGHALAGGLGLVVACDLALASEQATFGTTEIRVGLWPMMISAEIARSIGRKQALELMLTGKRISAADALAAGLINRVVPAGSLEAETMALARELAELSPATIALGLRAFYRSQDMELGAALRFLEGELGRVLALEDAREGLAAFLQKRKPVWKGR
ncbi:MAG TPA: enoyl-CoA hydratase-related protein [Kofleriaceae bacterium]|nr:enoyl-CoA hydratase-related protein [Kofleriaceae bacterium]